MPSFFFKDAPTPDFYPLSLHAALPIFSHETARRCAAAGANVLVAASAIFNDRARSEEHTSELQSRLHLVCRLFFLRMRRPPTSTLFPYTPLSRSFHTSRPGAAPPPAPTSSSPPAPSLMTARDRKSTRLNSSHGYISYAVFFF